MNNLVLVCLLVAGANAGYSPFYQGLIGYSGIVKPDGRNVQFTREQADNIVLVGPSGVVTRDGQNMQLRTKRSAGFVTQKGSVGYSGIHRADGSIDVFDQDFANNILLIGPGGIVLKNGQNLQLTEDLRIVGRSKRSAAGLVSAKGNIGYSGILRADGSTDLFDHDTAHNILLIGPSGIVTKDGQNMQLTDDLRIVGRSKRSAGFVSAKGNIGYSGILRADGSTDLFDHDTAHNILLIGPSGIVTRDGQNMQLTDDLRIANRNKRSTLNYGHSIGDSGIITNTGKQFQLPAGAKIVQVGPAGAILSNGQNIQF